MKEEAAKTLQEPNESLNELKPKKLTIPFRTKQWNYKSIKYTFQQWKIETQSSNQKVWCMQVINESWKKIIYNMIPAQNSLYSRMDFVHKWFSQNTNEGVWCH